MKRFLVLSAYVVASYGLFTLVVAGLSGLQPSAGFWLLMAVEVLAVGLYTAFMPPRRFTS